MQNQKNNQSESNTRNPVPNNPVYRRQIKRSVEAVKRLRNLNRIPKGVAPNKDGKFTATIDVLHYFATPARASDGDRRPTLVDTNTEETL